MPFFEFMEAFIVLSLSLWKLSCSEQHNILSAVNKTHVLGSTINLVQ